MSTLILRAMAFFGYIWKLSLGTYMPGGARPSTEVFYVFVAALAGMAILFGPARGGWRHLRQRPDLYVPFGCYLFSTQLINILPWPMASFTLQDPGQLFAAGAIATALAVIALVLAGLYLIWQTLLILQSLGDKRPALGRTLRRSLQVLGR